MRPKIGLALSGGAARGIAHIGVLKVLEEYKFPIDYIAGTSMGAIIGGIYASGISTGLLEEIVRSVRWRDITRVSFSKNGIMSCEPLEKVLTRILAVNDFSEVRIPFAVVAADIQTGKKVIINKGNLAHAIRISSTVPGFFSPVIDDEGRMLVDGGLAENLPVETAFHLGADKVIGVDVNNTIEMESPPTNLFQILMQSLMIIGRHSSLHQSLRANLLVEPKSGRIRFDELEQAAKLIDMGETAMREMMPRALELIKDTSANKEDSLLEPSAAL